MTIGKKLILASVISSALFALLIAAGWFGYRSVMMNSKAAGAFDRESTCLQMLFRGVNETLLTDGTPASIEITREALRCFDEAHALAMAAETDESVRRAATEKVSLKWEAIRKRLDPYLVENAVSHDDPRRMMEYGELVVAGDALMKEVRAMSTGAVMRMDEGVGRARTLVIIIAMLIVISVVSLYTDLFRSIAVPIKRLRLLMAEISSKAESGRLRGEEAVLLSERLTPREKKVAARITDVRELMSSFDTMIAAVNGHIDKRRAMEGRLQQLAATDGLTQAYNRTKFEEIIGREMDRAVRLRQPLSVIIFDVDRFKLINDSFGHLTGDDVLRTLASIARENIREGDYLVRWGGEEFLVVSPDTSIDKATLAAERLRKVMSGHAFEYIGSITASFGVAQYREGETRDSFILRADNAMYAAKKTRNRVEQAA